LLNGRYRLDEIIGGGATATIWRAWDHRLDRDVAVKVLDGTGLGRDAGERARLGDEARTLARLSHPNILAVFDSGVDNGVAYVVTEVVEDRSAARRLADGVMSVAEAASVMAQVCDALAAAHAAGVVHGDIKPGNILLGPGRTVRVCDFGIARLLHTTALTASDIGIGTSCYMSPEQVAGRPLDGRADLYAVGWVLFRMLTGIAPFVGENAFDVAHRLMHDQLPTVRSRRADVPEDLDRLVSRLLAEDPAQRPATAAEVRGELLRWSDPVTAVAGRLAARRRRPFAQAGVATIAVFAVPAALLVAGPQRQPAQPPTAVASPSSSPTAAVAALALASVSPSASASASATVTPAGTATSSVATAPSLQPEPSPPPRSALNQITDLKAQLRQLEATGQLSAKNADELDHMLKDLSNLVAQGKQREAHDKLAAIQKKNDDLLASRKISPAGHTALQDALDELAAAIADMPSA